MPFGGVAACCIFASGGYGCEFFDFGEEVFDQVPRFISVFIIIEPELTVRFWRDDRACTARVEFREKPIGAARLLMSLNNRAIDHCVLKICLNSDSI